MVVIRLARTGSKKNPFYHVVVADKRFPRDGRYIEQVGYYNPMARGKETRIQLDQERINYWVGTGAAPSDRVKHLIKDFKATGLDAKPLPTKAEFKKAQAEASKKAAAAKLKAEKEAAKAEANSDDADANEASAENAADADKAESAK